MPKETVFNEFKDHWKDSLTKTQLMNIKSDVHMKTPALTFKRKEQIVISRLQIGHTRITHPYIFKKEDPPICVTCKIPNNIEHILIHCQKYKENRKKTKISRNLKELLNNVDGCAKVIKFLNECNIMENVI